MSEPKINDLNNLFQNLKSLDRRIMYLENYLIKIENKIDYFDDHLNLLKNKSNRALDILRTRSYTIKVNLNEINKKIIKTILIIKHLAHHSDLNNLKEKLSELKIDEMVTQSEIKKMVEIRLLQDKKSLIN
jgi:hypothetical protein